jgi:Outer membrane lipoprotein-sorting protein
MRVRLAALATVLVASVAAAASPDVMQIVKDMRSALEPARPSIRKLTITISAHRGEDTSWTAAQAHTTVDGHVRTLTLILAPSDARGIAWLVQEGDAKMRERQFMWVPAIRRVRTLEGLGRYETFLGSDYTYADLGFVRAHAKYTLLGSEQKDGQEAYRVQAVPNEDWYYSKSIIWVAKDTSLPIERQIFDPAGVLWKVETFSDVSTIDGTPTITEQSMRDVQANSHTDIHTESVTYDAAVPAALLDPGQLPVAIESPVWSKLE